MCSRPTINKVYVDFEEADERISFCSASIQLLGEQMQHVLPADSKIEVDKNGCIPLFIIFKVLTSSVLHYAF
jgi:hypothetical protein